MDFYDNYFNRLTGNLEIIKITKDGKEEVIFDDHNVIVSGISVGLSTMFSLSGSQTITDFHLDRAQFGIGTQTATSSVYALSQALSSTSQYGTQTDLNIVSATQIKNGVDTANQVFVLIPFHQTARVEDTSVRYTIVLDENTANSLPGNLQEIGLFMKNHEGRASDASILVAYRTFSAITKSSDFALVFRWTINF